MDDVIAQAVKLKRITADKEKVGNIIVSTGRGGTGKSTFVALASRYLKSPLLLLDIDPDQSLADMLGVDIDAQTITTEIEDEDLYMIGTAEHPLAAYHMNETLAKLPVKYAGISSCFRKEAGSHGRDTRGIFRTHQFNKIEQFIFCTPEQSWSLHEELLVNAEDIMKKIGLPYRLVNVCTGDIGTVASKKFDIEVWMPAQNAYREIVSCSNCTDYQSRRLSIRYREKEGAPVKGFVHTLNSTAIATSRTTRAIIENFQQKDQTVLIPKVLHKYMNNIKKI